jgi:hypothetical protein
VDPEIREDVSAEVTRMGETMGALETVLIQKKKITKKKEGLQKEWLAYMSTTWKNAAKQLTDFMDTKVKQLKEEYDCDVEVKIKGKGSADTPDPEDAPSDVNKDKCASLEIIHDWWVSRVKLNLDAVPWDSKKRPKPTQNNSGMPDKTTKKPGGPSS